MQVGPHHTTMFGDHHHPHSTSAASLLAPLGARRPPPPRKRHSQRERSMALGSVLCFEFLWCLGVSLGRPGPGLGVPLALEVCSLLLSFPLPPPQHAGPLLAPPCWPTSLHPPLLSGPLLPANPSTDSPLPSAPPNTPFHPPPRRLSAPSMAAAAWCWWTGKRPPTAPPPLTWTWRRSWGTCPTRPSGGGLGWCGAVRGALAGRWGVLFVGWVGREKGRWLGPRPTLQAAPHPTPMTTNAACAPPLFDPPWPSAAAVPLRQSWPRRTHPACALPPPPAFAASTARQSRLLGCRCQLAPAWRRRWTACCGCPLSAPSASSPPRWVCLGLRRPVAGHALREPAPVPLLPRWAASALRSCCQCTPAARRAVHTRASHPQDTDPFTLRSL